jgi:hypothetical protein
MSDSGGGRSRKGASAEASRGNGTPNAASSPDSGSTAPSQAVSDSAVAAGNATAEQAPASAAQHAAQSAATPAADSLLFRLDDYEQVCTQALRPTPCWTSVAGYLVFDAFHSGRDCSKHAKRVTFATCKNQLIWPPGARCCGPRRAAVSQPAGQPMGPHTQCHTCGVQVQCRPLPLPC